MHDGNFQKIGLLLLHNVRVGIIVLILHTISFYKNIQHTVGNHFSSTELLILFQLAKMDWQIVDEPQFNMKSDDYSHLILHFFRQSMNASIS